MLKFSTRKGIIFKCACDPPTLLIESGLMATRLDGAAYSGGGLLLLNKAEPGEAGAVRLAVAPVALATCTCVGISAIESVCAC